MLCDNCKKNEATVHIKEFHNGKCETHHLCSECANAKEENGELGSIGLKLSELLFNAGKLSEAAKSGKAQTLAGPYDTLVCPVCSWTAAKIRKNNGKVGCPECYKVFSALLADAFARVQRGNVHLGKHPRHTASGDNGTLKLELKKLQTELAALVAREEYESAAICRDRINAIRRTLEENEK